MTTDKPQEKTLVVILGATATGKTDIGIRLAQAFRSEIISSDSPANLPRDEYRHGQAHR